MDKESEDEISEINKFNFSFELASLEISSFLSKIKVKGQKK